jgi:hypothetical protein
MTSEWRKSSRSSSQANGDCVEARTSKGAFEVRDSKLGDSSPIFGLDAESFIGLLRAAQR